ncbi:MAG TPA: hypothetical protein DEQ09_01445, partial [Bacteroidales bacterium]|nr:hypothetical protein [Bacteroidales bacterium]
MYLSHKKHLILSLILCVLVFIFPGCKNENQKIEYNTGNWNEDSLGYHRVVIENRIDADAVFVKVPWRRRDSEPWKKAIILTAAEPDTIINNIYCISSNNEEGHFVFQPVNGAGKYFLYYLPGKMKGRSNYPTVNYPIAVQTADNAWIELHNLKDSASVASLPEALVSSLQSRDLFNSFYPMEIIASENEISEMLDKHHGNSYLLFPEDRDHPIRMFDYLPQKWVKEGPSDKIGGEARKGEYFTFQVGLYCIDKDIRDIDIAFSDLVAGNNNIIVHHDSISSFNTGGINWDGKPFNKEVSIKKGMVQPLWFGFMVPQKTNAKHIKGELLIKPAGHEPETLKINIKISDKEIVNHGDDNPALMSRLRWLNSLMATDNEITYPFIPVERDNRSLKILGRQIDIGACGLPSRYLTYFNASNTQLSDKAENVLASPMTLEVYRSNGSKIYFVNDEPEFDHCGPGKNRWKTKCISSAIELQTEGYLEFDGFASVRIKLKALRDIDLSDIRLNMHVRKKFAHYIMGLGLRGGQRPYYLSWKWDQMKHQEGAWIGNVNGGLQFTLRDDNYERPLNTNFYREKPLVMPESWYNDGKGGINISSNEYTAAINCYSGSRSMKEEDELVFTVNFLFTPFKPIDTDKQWNTRFYHRYDNLDSIKEYGANVVNVHHATEINPWINYPFLEQEKMKNYIDDAHSKGMRVKIY